MSLSITPVHHIDECKLIEGLIARIWDCPPEQVVPDHMLITFVHNKGVVLLARWQNEPVGFAFGFPSWQGEFELHHHSHMAGVLPAYQDRNFATQIKLAQREAVLSQGLKRMTWTFDPLLTRNANLNLRKLGAISNTYLRNVYGELQDSYNAGGIPTDRFLLDWHLTSERVTARIAGQAQPTLPELTAQGWPVLNPPHEQAGWWHPTTATPVLNDEPFLLAVPANFTQMRQSNPPLAYHWRTHSREWFETAFALGYTAVNLISSANLCYYQMTRSG
jgi:predicted GNAT superfamily acetyltransferase